MEETKDVVVDTTNDTEVAPTGETAEQKITRLEATNKKLYERVKVAEPLAKELKVLKSNPLPTPEKKPIEDEVVQKVDRLEQIEKKRQFGYKNSLSPEETDLLFRYAGSVDPLEVLKDEDFKDLLEARRRRNRVADAIPSGSNRSVSIDGKAFKDMTPEERSKNWNKIVGKK